MSPLKPLSDCAAQAADLDEAGLRRVFPDPVLLVEPHQAVDTTGLQTLLGVKAAAAAIEEPLVAFVRKRPGANAFKHMVTVGRASTNDIVIRYAGVSNFHAYLVVRAGGAVELTDAGSSYGTSVGERRLRPRVDHATLGTGDIVRLSDLGMKFLDPEAFIRLLRAQP